MELGETKEALIIETAAWYLQVFEESLTLEELGPLCEEVSEKLRALGITMLFTDANNNLFCHHLIRSACVRIHFLERCIADNQLQNFRRASSRNEPLFDALAGGDFQRAQGIVEASPKEWLSNAEYEEDYAYTQILHELTREEILNEERTLNFFDQFERVIAGDSSARLDVCRALWGREQEDFNQAFEDLLNEQDEELDAQKARSVMEDSISVSNQRLFIEGLGLLRLADNLGLTTESEYRYCPALARLPMTIPFPGE